MAALDEMNWKANTIALETCIRTCMVRLSGVSDFKRATEIQCIFPLER